MVTGFVAFTVFSFFAVAYYRAEEAQDSIDQAQLDKIGRAFINNAERIYYQGKPARAFIEDRFPENIQEVRTVSEGENYVLQFIPTPNTGLSEVSYPSDVPIDIVISNAEELGGGRYRWQLTALDNKVSIAYSNPYELWFRFDDYEREFIRDYSGNGVTAVYDIGAEGWNDLGATGPITTTKGAIGQGVFVTGGTNELRGTIPAIPLDDFTISLWFAQSPTLSCPSSPTMTFCHVFGVFDGHRATIYVTEQGTNWRYLVKLQSVGPTNQRIEGLVFTLPKSNTAWHHLALTFDGTYVRVYLDGEEKYSYAAADAPTTVNKVSDEVALGNDVSGGNAWAGYIDEFRIYTTALTKDQIQEDMKSRYPLTLSNAVRPVASFSFEQDGAISIARNTKNLVKGSKGGALSFDGVDDELAVTTLLALGDDFTMGLDYRIPGQSYDYPRFFEATSSSSSVLLRAWPRRGSPGINGRIQDNSGTPAVDFNYHSQSITDNMWHELDIVIDDQSRTIYHDGSPEPTVSGVFQSEFTFDTIYYGADGIDTPTYYLRGTLDEIYISTQPLTIS